MNPEMLDTDYTENGCPNCSCEKDCDDSCESNGCGGNSCCSCGGNNIEGKNVGKKLKVHYEGTFNDGTQFDSSYDRREPLEFVCGAGMMIKGFDKAVANMELGEIINIHLMPEEAYGNADPNAIFELEISKMPGSEDLVIGDKVYLENMMGQQIIATVIQKDDIMISFDANHEMAGKELNFKIELVGIE